MYTMLQFQVCIQQILTNKRQGILNMIDIYRPLTIMIESVIVLIIGIITLIISMCFDRCKKDSGLITGCCIAIHLLLILLLILLE